MLPLISAIASDLIPLWQTVTGTRKRLKHLIENRGVELGNPYSDELGEMEARLASQSIRVESFVDELRELGVEFKGSGENGHICFPTMLEGKLVYLSWCPGELEVTHWIDFDGEFESRQALMQSALAAD